MRVNVLTDIRRGGPRIWGANLASTLGQCGIEAKHVHTLGALLCSPIYQDADIIHTILPLSYRLWKKPVIITIHGAFHAEKNIWRFFYPAAIRKADIVTSSSAFLKERLNLDKAIVIPNSIFPDRFRMVEHTDKDTINLVTVTHFYFQDKARGILDILKFLDTVTRMVDKKVKYVVVGGGPHLESVMSEAKRYKVDVEFTGNIPSTAGFLEGSDIFIYFSHLDNFPLAILEAMASGLPVITNNIGAVSEIIDSGQDGYIAESKETYLEYLLYLIGDCELRQKIGRKARAKVEEKFSWDGIIGQYIRLYNQLLTD